MLPIVGITHDRHSHYSLAMDTANAPQRLRVLPSWLLGQAAAESRRAVGVVLDAEWVHRSQYALLASLEEFGQQSQADLSDRSGLDRSDVVRWVDELEAAGLVGRERDPADRRRNVISMTAAGRRRLKTLDRQLTEAQGVFLGALSPVERDRLVALLGRLLGL